jgi:hypothetical protein
VSIAAPPPPLHLTRPLRKSALGERAAVVGDRTRDDRRVAAREQHVRDAVVDLGAFRDRKQVVLAHGARIFDEQVIAYTWRLGEHGTGHLDRTIEGEQANNLERRIGRRGKTAAEGSAGRDLKPLSEPHHDIVEQLDLCLRKAACPRHEEIGDPAQHVGAARDTGAGHRILKLLKQPFARDHDTARFSAARRETPRSSLTKRDSGTGAPNR